MCPLSDAADQYKSLSGQRRDSRGVHVRPVHDDIALLLQGAAHEVDRAAPVLQLVLTSTHVLRMQHSASTLSAAISGETHVAVKLQRIGHCGKRVSAPLSLDAQPSDAHVSTCPSLLAVHVRISGGEEGGDVECY